MKILIVHNFYGSSAPSGENNVVNNEINLLRKYGHDVHLYGVSSDKIRNNGVISKSIVALSVPYNFRQLFKITKFAKKLMPDIIHIHNTFPLLSNAIFRGLHEVAPVVMTLHNYRLVCPAAIPLRNGSVCTLCIDNEAVSPSIRYGCYRSSKIATIPLALSVALHRKLNTFSRYVDGFIALSDFQAKKMALSLLPAESIHLKPNFIDNNVNILDMKDRDNTVTFIGRLSKEKGVDLLLTAWAQLSLDATLNIIGDGPLLATLTEKYASENVTFLGGLAHAGAMSYLRRSKLLVMPSVWFEGFPMTLVEAFSLGVPAIVSDIGSLPEIVVDDKFGKKFKSGDVLSLKKTLHKLWHDETALMSYSQNAHTEYLASYTSSKNYAQLMMIYKRIINDRAANAK